MIDIKKLQTGQTVWEIKKSKRYSANCSEWSHWPVKIKEVNLEEGYVVASWNHNPPRKYYARKGKFGWFKEQK